MKGIIGVHKKEAEAKFKPELHNSTLGSMASTLTHLRRHWQPNTQEILNHLSEQLESFKKDNLGEIEERLFCQGQALQIVFERAISGMAHAEGITSIKAWSQIALKAQEQSRKTLTTLINMRQPKQTSFIKQQNNAVNQQINSLQNSENFSTLQNELLEAHDERLDTRTTTTTSNLDSHLETVETVNRR